MKNMVKVSMIVAVLAMVTTSAVTGQRGYGRMMPDSARMEMRQSMRMHRDSLVLPVRPGMNRGFQRPGQIMNQGFGRRNMWAGPGYYSWRGSGQWGPAFRKGFGASRIGRSEGMAPQGRTLESVPNLTEKQREQIADLRIEQMENMSKLRIENAKKMNALREDHRKKILNILTDEQKKYLNERIEGSNPVK